MGVFAMRIRDDHTILLSLFAPPVLVAVSFYLLSLSAE